MFIANSQLVISIENGSFKMFLLTLIAGFVLILWLFKLNKDYHILAFFAPRIKTIDGSPVETIAPILPGNTIFGNTFDVIGVDFAGIFTKLRQNAAELKRSYIEYMFGKTILNVIDAELAEMVLTDATLITKGFTYDYLKPALGDGLLVSTDRKWHSRRKLLTPAFHFNILAQFEEIFKEHSQHFIEKLKNSDTDVVLLNEVIPKFTLSVVCETALGVKLDKCSNDDEYRKSIRVFDTCLNRRMSNPFLMIDLIYNYFEAYKYEADMKVVHDFSSDIIKKRRQMFEEELNKNQSVGNDLETEEFGTKKKRNAMLDTLLHAERQGLIDHEGICEEVDTFIFGGFDTTSIVLMFNLMNLSLYQDMQERCYQEIMENITNFDDIDVAQLSTLKYLDCFIKESMRMHNTVPTIMREAVKETKLANGLILPAHSFISIHLHDIGHNPKHFKNPSTFDPERFSPENSQGRHPLAFSPFSAGQRNCIGQKFAMLETKTLLINIIRNFKILPLTDPSKVIFEVGITLRTKTEIKVKLEKRK